MRVARHAKVDLCDLDGEIRHRTTMDDLAALVRAARRIIEERDTGKPDPAAWVELRNAIREREEP